ncbi:uncharacterized protein K489DRAFT_87286 [Dissoconium aciculare CBS 342.82]|uniref:Uncharacterized protein n=1 Tax=Dissoconium aciculare CBS 342.82 TaxID=1314786 RepID=A0A6J3LTP1_9PEZI|nr:uncharacterized protein K489DRAFT_87286 [Dissoconium aciculare CBS 342.82]KAF1818644.1 hypothetical protein K489DRAFT_87286 [Dissoconium aciculare CBS 342.82]
MCKLESMTRRQRPRSCYCCCMRLGWSCLSSSSIPRGEALEGRRKKPHSLLRPQTGFSYRGSSCRLGRTYPLRNRCRLVVTHPLRRPSL